MPSPTDADRALKNKHRAMWAWGDYPKVADDLIAEFGPVIVKAAGITAGQRVLDVAAGDGNASLPAARAGARVVASDLTPELLSVGARRAAEEGLELEWVEADAEALPFPDDDFDAVISAVGVMFAPHPCPWYGRCRTHNSRQCPRPVRSPDRGATVRDSPPAPPIPREDRQTISQTRSSLVVRPF